MQKKDLKKSLLLLFCFLLSSCAVKPKDDPLCKELSLSRGYCVHMLSGKAYEVNEETKLNGKTWWEMRPTNIQMPVETWKNLKAFVINVCKKYQNCDESVSSWERSIGELDQKVNSSKGAL